jgi:hypothetical protein
VPTARCFTGGATVMFLRLWVRWRFLNPKAGGVVAMLPDELSPVIRKRTVRSPIRMVSSEGLTWRSKICCVMGPIGKRRLRLFCKRFSFASSIRT